jgi:hypothetical protein
MQSHVKDDPERMQWLNDMGFVWGDLKRQWEVAKEALATYKQLRGDLEVPFKFVVPESEEWRKGMWGMKLGHMVQSIRSKNAFVDGNPERRQWLEEAGFRFETADSNDEQWEKKMPDVFVCDSQERRLWLEEAAFRFEIAESNQAATDEQWEKKVLPAITTYKQVHGDLQVPFDFIVPSSGKWEEGLWNMRLGTAVNRIRTNSNFVWGRPDRQKQLDKLGFVWDEFERQWEVVKEALSMHKRIYGDMTVKRRFVVPKDEEWPEETWGMKLGRTVSRIRSSNAFVDGNPERR